MRSLKVKFKTDGVNFSSTLAHPLATPGDNKDASVQIREITDIPDNISDHQVLRLWNQTVDATAYGSGRRYTFQFSELGVGVMLR